MWGQRSRLSRWRSTHMPARAQQRCSNLQYVLVSFGALLTFYAAYRGLLQHDKSPKARSIVHAKSITLLQQGTAYNAEALANVTRLKHTLLANMVPKMRQNGSLPNYGLRPDDWALFESTITCPPQRPLKHYGGEQDGSKYLCDVSGLGPGCVIYSMGSRGDYKFEEDMLRHTTCEVHTFDCTYNGTSRHPSRHMYHKWCIAGQATVAAKGPSYRTWSNVTKSLGHKSIHILKMDTDGYEYEVFGEFVPGGDIVLPNEIVVELHVMIKPKPDARPWLKKWLLGLPDNIPHTVPALGLVFMHLADIGYGVYHVDINTGAPECCSEFSLLRILD